MEDRVGCTSRLIGAEPSDTTGQDCSLCGLLDSALLPDNANAVGDTFMALVCLALDDDQDLEDEGCGARPMPPMPLRSPRKKEYANGPGSSCGRHIVGMAGESKWIQLACREDNGVALLGPVDRPQAHASGKEEAGH